MSMNPDTMTDEQFEAYRALCDSRSSAEYRFRREVCGIEIAEIAEDLDVRLDTAKRWENPKKGHGPSVRAWAYVDSAYEELMEAVEAAVRQAEDGPEDMEAHVAYRRGNLSSPDGETVGRANAVSRAVVIALRALGYGASVDWSDEATAPRGRRGTR